MPDHKTCVQRYLWAVVECFWQGERAESLEYWFQISLSSQVLYPPEERASWQLRDFLFGQWLDDKCLLRYRCR